VSDPRWTIRAHLRTCRDAWPAEESTRLGLVYRGPADFLLQHGRWWKPAPRPAGMPQGARKACYGNAIGGAVMLDLRYVQGYAISPVEPELPIPHAWNANADGNVVDLTWWPVGIVYFGVELSAERADDGTWNGNAEPIDDRLRGWPLLRERWRGELAEPDPSWVPSPPLRALRARRDGRPEAEVRRLWALGEAEIAAG
jgi:hypothetical protein